MARITAKMKDIPVRHRQPYVKNLISKFMETAQVAIMGHAQLDKVTSNFRNFTQYSVQRTLKQLRFHSYKIHVMQELNENNPERHIQFCEETSERILNNPNILCAFLTYAHFPFMVTSTDIIVYTGVIQVLQEKSIYSIQKRSMFGLGFW